MANPIITGQTAEIVEEFLPIIRSLAFGRYAISIGGSMGKGGADEMSDVDFRLFCDEMSQDRLPSWHREIAGAMGRWQARGRLIDGCWVRTIAEIDSGLDHWLSGEALPDDIQWTIWGYHLLTDIANQLVIEDPHSVIAAWKDRLRVYPPKLKEAVLRRHMEFARYWRDDYHYRHKVQRRDAVFLAGLTSKIVHSLIQVLFALNEVYYVGDGRNLDWIARFERVPAGFVDEVERALYPPPSPRMMDEQYERVLRLIAAVDEMVGTA